MRAARKRLIWSLGAAGIYVWAIYQVIKNSSTPDVSFACGVCAFTSAFILVRVGRRFTTPIRQEWDLGWGRRLAIGILGLTVVIAIFVTLGFGLGSPEIFSVRAVNFNAVICLGLQFGALLGCGGVLNVPEDVDSKRKGADHQ